MYNVKKQGQLAF